MCGVCQLGKKTKYSHTKSQLASTTRVLELLHMDLMELMQVESIAGKRYIYVFVDDFSRFSWMNFLRDKS